VWHRRVCGSLHRSRTIRGVDPAVVSCELPQQSHAVRGNAADGPPKAWMVGQLVGLSGGHVASASGIAQTSTMGHIAPKEIA
jgi:hypothetical protein